MIKDLYTIKSFFSLGDSLPKCYGCDYCRADDGDGHHYHTLPSEINPLFRSLPVAVNLFYGDPTLQWNNTISLLRRLEEDKHVGPIVIITKGKLPDIPKMDIDLHVGISIGPDVISQKNFEYNLGIASKAWYKSNIEYRPICNGINDGEETIKYIIELADKYDMCVAYSGLQLPPKGLPDKYIPYDNRKFGGQKYISKEVDDLINCYAKKHNVKLFKKTSCLISYQHNFNHDYNAHFLKPVGVGCKDCEMFDKCRNFKLDDIKLPFEYTTFEENDYVCSFVKAGLCKVPNKECLHMVGTFIKPNLKEITRGDARVIKWLTGCMVTGVDNLVETPYLSDFWKVIEKTIEG